jgi:predicted amino acid-binding ACT domain protein
MTLTDIVRYTHGPFIPILFYHRSQIAMMLHTKFSVAYFYKNFSDTNRFEMPQMVVTPFPFSEWPFLWKMSISIKDRIGVVNDVTEVINQHHLNILNQVSYPVESNSYHVLKMIFSASYYKSRKVDEIKHIMRSLRETLLVNHLHEIKINRPGIDGMYDTSLSIRHIRRYSNLYHYYHDLYIYAKDRVDHRSDNVVTIKGNIDYQIASKKDCSEKKRDPDKDKKAYLGLKMDAKMYEELKRINGFASEAQYLPYIAHTNNSNQITSIYFPQRHRAVYAARIHHNDELGAIATISKALRDEGVSLFSTLTRKGSKKNSQAQKTEKDAAQSSEQKSDEYPSPDSTQTQSTDRHCDVQLDSNEFEFLYEIPGFVAPKEPKPCEGYYSSYLNHSEDSGSPHVQRLTRILQKPEVAAYCPRLYIPRYILITHSQFTEEEQKSNSPETPQNGATFDPEDSESKPQEIWWMPNIWSRWEEIIFKKTIVSPKRGSQEHDYQKNTSCIDYSEIRKKLEKHIVEIKDKIRLSCDRQEIKTLKAQVEIAQDMLLNSTFAVPKVFISYRFDDLGEKVLYIIKKFLKEKGFEVVVAKDLKDQFIVEGIYGAISNCHFWIGVLTPDYIHKKKKKDTSPWLLWEHGIARGCKNIIARRVMASKDVHIPRNLHAKEVPRFDETDLRFGYLDIERIINGIADEFWGTWKHRFD